MRLRWRSLVILGMILYGGLAWGANNNCRDQAREALRQGHSSLIISFEGLFSKMAGYVRNGLMKPLEEEMPNQFSHNNYGWRETRAAFNCILQWREIFGNRLNLTIIGHSFGAGYATFELLDDLRRTGIAVRNVITLDPRTARTDSNYRRSGDLKQFERPGNVGNFVNLYQRSSGLPGFEVRGAQNIRVEGTSHTRIPSHATTAREVRNLLRRTLAEESSPGEPIRLVPANFFNSGGTSTAN